MRFHKTLRPTRWAVVPLLAIMLFATSCKKKSDPDGAPDAVATDLFLFAHIRAQDLQKTTLFDDIRKGVLPLDGADASWDQTEQQAESAFGIRPSQIDTITLCMPDSGNADANKIMVIVTCQSDIVKDRAMQKMRGGNTNRPDFVALQNGLLLHFPDAKTMVVVHDDLADRYLAGYAKDRNGWPFTAAIRKAADEHMVLVAMNLEKAPANADEKTRPLIAKSAVLALDIKDTEYRIAVRGTYPDNSSAQNAKNTLDNFIAEGKKGLNELINSPASKQNGGVFGKMLERAKQTLDTAKIEVVGADVKVAATFTGDFPVGPALLGGVQNVRVAAHKSNSLNNLRQMAIALNMFNTDYDRLPIYGIMKGGGFPVNEKEKDKVILSWRVAILPYIEQKRLYDQFNLDEPWDSEHNKKLIDKMPKTFAPPTNVKAAPGQTYFQMVVGPAAMRPPMAIQSIPDGSTFTFAVVEAAQPVIWTKPDDILIPGNQMPDDLKAKFGSSLPNMFLAVFWDGSARSIDLRKITNKTLWALITPNGSDMPDSDF